MLLSYRNKFIFIHNAKTAGTSIQKALSRYSLTNPSPYPSINKALEFLPKSLFGRNCKSFVHGKILPIFINKSKYFENHYTAKQIKERLPFPLWNSCFKFGFVRNPWDLMVSLYFFSLRMPNYPNYKDVKSKTFNEFLEWRFSFNKKLNLQKDFFYNDDGDCLVNFIGRFENLRNDCRYVCQQIGIDFELPHMNESRRKKDYGKYYIPKYRDLVAEYFREDIEIFGYEF